jgi:hypothetical protein
VDEVSNQSFLIHKSSECFEIVCFAFREKWSIKDEGDCWGSITVIIKIPLSTEMVKFLNLLQFDRKIAMRLRNTKTMLKAPNEIDFNRTNPK